MPETRRNFLARAAAAAALPRPALDRAMGAFLGAAIGDAMAGPVECQHAARIRKHYGTITGFLPYRKPPGLIALGPGYALHADPGSITDDTFIRCEITRFYIETSPPRTPPQLADWLLAHADFRTWWKPAVEALERIRRGEVTAENGGLTHNPGGGGAWWTPTGILHGGNPAAAAAEIRSLCRPWKAPLEREILAAVHAGTAEALRQGATADSVTGAVLAASGGLARRLFARAAEIGRAARDGEDLWRRLYRHCLVIECTSDDDGAMPPAIQPAEYADGFYTSVLFAEQQPFALATFVFAQGEPRRAILQSAQNGRDADSIASNVGGWAGALHGESGLPRDWVEAVCRVNRAEVDLRQLARRLLDARA